MPAKILAPALPSDQFEICTAQSTDTQDLLNLQMAIWGKVRLSESAMADPLFGGHCLLIRAATDFCSIQMGELGGKTFEKGDPLGFNIAYEVPRYQGRTLLSRLTGIRSEIRNRQLGRRLKVAQRNHAMSKGIYRIEWETAPWLMANWWTWICKLGCRGVRYVKNYHGLEGTDRMIFVWYPKRGCKSEPKWKSDFDEVSFPKNSDAPLLLKIGEDREPIWSPEALAVAKKQGSYARVQLPARLDLLEPDDPSEIKGLAKKWLTAMRNCFGHALESQHQSISTHSEDDRFRIVNARRFGFGKGIPTTVQEGKVEFLLQHRSLQTPKSNPIDELIQPS